MRKRIIIGALILSLCFLCGCQLAVPAGDPTGGEPDCLIGVYITTEYVDLFDAESLNNLKGNTLLTPDDTGNQRLWGEFTENELVFPGITGMALANLYQNPDESDSGYWTTLAGIGINHIHSSYKTTDTTDEREITASIYYSHTAGEPVFYFNPIYQTSDGRVYLLSGQGMSMTGHPGAEMSQKMDNSVTAGPKGEETGYRASFEVTIRCVEVPESVTLLHMSADHRILKEDTYLPDQMPEEITPQKEAAYLLIETKLPSGISITIQQPGNNPIETLVATDNGICDIITTRILWEDPQ